METGIKTAGKFAEQLNLSTENKKRRFPTRNSEIRERS
jgi:hypothetical protein